LQAAVPELLRETSNGLLRKSRLRLLDAEEQIDIGVRKEQAAAKASDGGDGNAFAEQRFSGDFGLPKAENDIVDQSGTRRGGAEAVAIELKATTNFGKMPIVLSANSGAACALVFYRCSPLQRYFSALVVANPDGFVDLRNKDLSVSDAACAGRCDDGLNGFFGELVGDDEFEFDLGKKVYSVLPAAVELGVAFLATVTARLKDGDAGYSRFYECIFYCVQFGGLDDCFDLLHCLLPLCTSASLLLRCFHRGS
jgi:hypothetical protein